MEPVSRWKTANWCRQVRSDRRVPGWNHHKHDNCYEPDDHGERPPNPARAFWLRHRSLIRADQGRYTLSWCNSMVNEPSMLGRALPPLLAIGTALVFATGLQAQDSWSATTTTGAPSGRGYQSTIWTGREMIVWGGRPISGPLLNTGGRYNPSSDTWAATSLASPPVARERHTTVWTGREMIVWGGDDSGGNALNTGARYDPVSDTWTPMSTAGAPSARTLHTAIWTGREMVVWGGWDGTTNQTGGGRYDPATNTWTPTSSSGEPTARIFHTAVWTGREMIVWGGRVAATYFGDGGRYDPITDSWTAISPVAPRSDHTAVWTGREMIVWGGLDSLTYGLETGLRYDPLADTWTGTSLADSPGGRTFVSAVWTGREMMIWGGSSSVGQPLGTGSRYDPLTDSWSAINPAGAPSPRSNLSVSWADNRMIVWGGANSGLPNDGAVYQPPISPKDSWGSTSLVGAPEARSDHASVWTGREMIVWGGSGEISNPLNGHRLNSGGRYDFVTKSWTPTNSTGAPTPRLSPTGVWTGREMIVWGSDGTLPAGLVAGTIRFPIVGSSCPKPGSPPLESIIQRSGPERR